MSNLAGLLRRVTIDDHEEVLKAANAALKTNKADREALRAKIVALLKLDRFDEALHVLEAGGSSLKEKSQLEHAYALYKTGKPQEAADIAAGAAERGARHLEAQARYRSEDFARAAELYDSLSPQGSGISNEEVDLRINSSAVDAQLAWAGQGHLVRNKKPGRQDLEAFETAYNAACGSIARGELQQADILLKRSKDLCNALDDLSDDEKRAELLPITTQQVYVLVRLGRNEEAQALTKSITAEDISDATSKSIARINGIAASTSENPFMLQRVLESTTSIPANDKPFRFQKAALDRNEAAVALASQKFDGTIKATNKNIKSKALPTLDVATNSSSVLNAAAHARTKVGKDALKLILPELEKRPADVGLILVIVQLYVLTGNTETATILLERFLARLETSSPSENLDVRYSPGLVGTLISLYTTRGQAQHARRELGKAAKHWRGKPSTHPSSHIVNLLKSAGAVLVDSPSSEDQSLAHSIFIDLSKQFPDDTYVSASLIASTASTSPDKIADSDVSSLTPVSTLTAGIDASALETAGVARPPATTTSHTTKTSAKRPAEVAAPTPKQHKKPKPSKLPKDYDPGKTPDPERWLPLRDRSTYRPKGKKGKQKANLYSQGAVEEAGTRSSTPVEKSQVVSGGGGGKAKGKKKGKGGKW